MPYYSASKLNKFIGKVKWMPITFEEFKSYYK